MKPTLLAVLALSLSPISLQAAVHSSYDFSGATTEGWTGGANGHAGTLSASLGNLIGTATGNDPQLLLSPALTVGIGETWSTIEIRVRETDSASGLYIGSAGAPAFNLTGTLLGANALLKNGNTLGDITATADSDNYYILSADISSLGSTTITSLRVDPVGGALSNSGSETNGNTFEVDYVRLYSVPEPSAALIGGLGALCLLRRRRQ